MTLRSATTMNADTPVNYFRDNQHALKLLNKDPHSQRDTVLTVDKLPFVHDNIFDIEAMHSSSPSLLGTNQTNQKINDRNTNIRGSSLLKHSPRRLRRVNNENVNTDNRSTRRTFTKNQRGSSNHHDTDTDTTEDDAMSLEEEEMNGGVESKQSEIERTPPARIKRDDLLTCDTAMEMDVDHDVSSEFSSSNKPGLSRKCSFSGLSQVMDGINIKTPNRNTKSPMAMEQDHSLTASASRSVSAHIPRSKRGLQCDPSTVIDAVWCYFPHFPSSEPERCLCLLQNENITVLSLSGEIYYVPLPCETRSMWSLPEGLLIQAKPPDDTNNTSSSSSSSSSTSPNQEMVHYPVLFSLLNPLEELRPVSLHLLNPKSKLLFFDDYYHKVAVKLQCNTRHSTPPSKMEANSNRRYSGLSLPDSNKSAGDGMESPSKRAQRFGTKTRQSRQSSPLSTMCTPKRDRASSSSKAMTTVHGDFFSSNDEVVIFSCITQPIVVTFNTTSYYHTIWVLRHDQKEIRKRNSGPKTKKRRKRVFDESLLDAAQGVNSSDDDDFDASKMLHSSLMHPRNGISTIESEKTGNPSNSKLHNQTSISNIRGVLASSGHHDRTTKSWRANLKGTRHHNESKLKDDRKPTKLDFSEMNATTSPSLSSIAPRMNSADPSLSVRLNFSKSPAPKRSNSNASTNINNNNKNANKTLLLNVTDSPNPHPPFPHLNPIQTSSAFLNPNNDDSTNKHHLPSPIPPPPPMDSNLESSDDEDGIGLFSELFVECCWKEKVGVLYEKVKSIYGESSARSIDFNEECTVFFASDIYNDPLICFFRPRSGLFASYRLTCKSMDCTFSGKCGVGVNNALSEIGSTSLNIELLFVWMGVRDVVPIRSLRSLSHCDDDDYHYYQFYSLHSHNTGIRKAVHNGANTAIHRRESTAKKKKGHRDGNQADYGGNDDFEALFNGNGTQSHSLLHQMQEMSAFDFDLLVFNERTKLLSIYSANYKLCDIVLPQSLNLSMIQSLNHAVNNRVSLQCLHGEQYRMVIPRWDKSIRVIAVLKCFQLFLSPDLMHCVRILLIELHNANGGKLWDELCQIILYLVTFSESSDRSKSTNSNRSKQSYQLTTSRFGLDSNPKKSKSAWQRLKESDFHQIMTENEPLLSTLKIRDDDDNNNGNGNGGNGQKKKKKKEKEFEHFVDQNNINSFIDSTIYEELERIVAQFDALSLKESNDKSKWDAPNEFVDIKCILSSIGESVRFDILLSIHLLYENCKLSILLKSHLEPLCLLLSQIALQIGMYSYFDSYCRDFGHRLLPKLSKSNISSRIHDAVSCGEYNDKNICPVPSIYHIVIECMRGNRKLLDDFPLPPSNLLFDLSTVLEPGYQSTKKKKKNRPQNTRKDNNDEDVDPLRNSPFYTGSAIFSPLLGPYSLLRKICYFYDILTKKEEPRPSTKHLFVGDQTPRTASRYSLRFNGNESHYLTPLQPQKTCYSYITPYTPSSIKKTNCRTAPRRNILTPSTPFTTRHSSFVNRSGDSVMYRNMSLSTGFRQRTRLNMSRMGQINEPYPFFSPSFLVKEEKVYEATNRAEQLVLAMVEENFTLTDIDNLPLGIALPLREALRSCRYNPTMDWPKAAYLLIGREDLTNKEYVADDVDSGNGSGTGSGSGIGSGNGTGNGLNDDDDDDDKDEMMDCGDRDERKSYMERGREEIGASPLGISNNVNQHTISIHNHGDREYNINRSRDMTQTLGSAVSTFVHRDKYKYEFGRKPHRGYLGKRYQVQKLLQQIGPPAPKFRAVNDINAMHKSTDNIRSATKTLKSLFMTSAGFLQSSMAKSTRQRLMTQVGGGVDGNLQTFADPQLMAKPDHDGTLTVLDECLLRFGSDYRLKEVRRILRSDKARRIRDVTGDGRMAERHNQGRNIADSPAHHLNLFQQIKRRLAQCVGRGMFTIWSYCPTATKPIEIPHLNIGGVAPLRTLSMDLDFRIIHGVVSKYLNNVIAANNGMPPPPPKLTPFDSVIFQEYEDVDRELFVQWVEFHNGCSAGLRVLSNYDESRQNIRTWICYNRPKAPSYAHAGFVFAQGLNGHLTCLMPADFYWYLGHKHEPTTMAIILGLSIARRGTMDTYVHKICCLHIASMVPGGFAELGIETTVQAAALLGCGFLFMATKHKLSTDMLLVEMVRRSSSSGGMNSSSYGGGSGNSNIEDRECYSLSAGIALGLIHLGCGGQSEGDSLSLENRLEQLMGSAGKRCKMLHYLYDIFNARTSASSNFTGSSRPTSRHGINTGIPGGAGANSQSTVTGLSVFATSNIINPSIAEQDAGVHNLQKQQQSFNIGGIGDPISENNHLRATIQYFMPNFSDFPDIHDDYNANDDELNGNSRIRDGQWVNTNMTAPGAILAFGLMYLKTNNESAAKRLVIPTKPYLLDHIQPEWIYLKVLCKSVILWSSITHKQQYIDDQIPPFIANNFPYHRIIRPHIDHHRHQYYREKTQFVANMDYHAITLAFINIISASCFAIGLKYAGTHHKLAADLVRHYLEQFKKCRKPNNGCSAMWGNDLNVDRYTIESTMGMLAIALSLIMCGSGDLSTFKLFREIRICLDRDITYGQHQMYSMCIGFLFLGGGKLTLGHSKLAVAALMISCYPRFPIHTLDNQFHLQVLRHLYVLAIEKRHITTIDVDTELPVKVPIKVQLLNRAEERREGKEYKKKVVTMTKMTPCLLPDYNKLVSISIECREFWDISFNRLQTNTAGWQSIVRHGIIYLKRRTGYTSKGHDTQYQYNNIVNVLHHDSSSSTNHDVDRVRSPKFHKRRSALFDNNKKKQADLVKAFGADPNILEFAKQFCSPFTRMGKFCGFALYECLSNAKSEMIQTYIKLYHAMSISESRVKTDHFMVWDIKLLNAYYQNHYGRDWDIENVEPLIQREFVAALQNKFESLYRSLFENEAEGGRKLLIRYIENGWNLGADHHLQTLGAFLSYSELDCSLILKNALKSLKAVLDINIDVDLENVDGDSNVNVNGDGNGGQNRNRNNNKMSLPLLPLLNIAIDSEIKQIHSSFGYYGEEEFEYNPSNRKEAPAARTPSMGIFTKTPNHPKVADTPNRRRIGQRSTGNQGVSVSACLPRSFGLSVLTNVLTK